MKTIHRPRAKYLHLILVQPGRLTLPRPARPAPRPDAPTAAGRLAGLAFMLLVAAAFWAGILALAWMIAGWLL